MLVKQREFEGLSQNVACLAGYIGVMDVLNPASRRPRRLTMTSNAEEPANPPAAAQCSHRKPPNAPTLRDTAAVSRPASQSRERKANSAERQPKSQKAAKQAKPAAGAREGSMAAKVLSLLRRPDGASLKELMKAHGLVGAFCPQVPPRRGRQADEAEARVREERGRGAPLQSQRLNFHYPNPNSAAADSPLRRFLVQYPPGYDGQEHCDKRLSCANA